jgi:hypothetical protein
MIEPSQQPSPRSVEKIIPLWVVITYVVLLYLPIALCSVLVGGVIFGIGSIYLFLYLPARIADRWGYKIEEWKPK